MIHHMVLNYVGRKNVEFVSGNSSMTIIMSHDDWVYQGEPNTMDIHIP